MTDLRDMQIDSLAMDITLKCNYSCKHCFNYSGEHSFGRKELTDEEIIREAEQVIEILPLGSCFCGGEPLLRRRLVLNIAKKMKDSGLSNVNMVSNGFFVDKKCAEEIYKSELDVVQISVDGFNNETHDWIRNLDGARERAIGAIKNLRDAGVRVGVACTPTKNSILEIKDLLGELNSLGVEMFRMQPIMNMGRAKTIKNYFPSRTDYFKLSRFLNALSRENKYDMKIEWGDPTEHIHSMSEGHNMRSLTINAYGDILVSPYIPISFGNTKRHTLLEYIHGGLSDVYKYDFLKIISSTIKDANDLDVSSYLNLPELYNEDLIHVDLIDDDMNKWNEKIIERMQLE